jgi:hypothetical protein
LKTTRLQTSGVVQRRPCPAKNVCPHRSDFRTHDADHERHLGVGPLLFSAERRGLDELGVLSRNWLHGHMSPMPLRTSGRRLVHYPVLHLQYTNGSELVLYTFMYIYTASFLWCTVRENIGMYHSHKRAEAPSCRHHWPGQSISYMHRNDKKDVS